MLDLDALPDPLPVAPAAGPLHATVEVPGSKSVTNRAWICAALAEGTSTLRGVLRSDDTEAMVGALAAAGIVASIATDASGAPVGTVEGVAGRVPPAVGTIDARQSGTTSRFILPLLALGEGEYQVMAHPQMQERPMGETFAALRALGVEVDDAARPGHLPVSIRTGGARGGALAIAGDVSSQFLSGLLLAGPCFAEGLELRLTTPLVSRPYVELTIAVMEAFGATVEQPGPSTFRVLPTGYRAADHQIEPDASAASYPLAAAALCGGEVTVRHLGRGARQGDAAFAEVLGGLGAEVAVTDDATTVRGDGQLRGGTFDFTHISDTAQTLAAIAPFAQAPVAISGIGFIRRKEIDRIAAVATELRRCGVRVDVDDDGWTIHPGTVAPTVIETYDDHRMAMSFALVGLRAPGIEIAGPRCVAKTFPGYWDLLDQLRASASGR